MPFIFWDVVEVILFLTGEQVAWLMGAILVSLADMSIKVSRRYASRRKPLSNRHDGLR